MTNQIPKEIRVSLGSAILLNLTTGKMTVKPTTVYLLTYREGKCLANCGFCSQARSSTSSAQLLSRVIWPVFPTWQIMDRLKNVEQNLIRRICIQTINYPQMFEELLALVHHLCNEGVKFPLSVSSQPLTFNQLSMLKKAGIDRISIPLDASTPSLFTGIKGSAVGGPYRWSKHVEAIKAAVQVLGKGNVSTHFIVGLGERDDELLPIIQKMVDLGVYPSLFAFTPVRGTRLEEKNPPQLKRYRRIQLAHYLITKNKMRVIDLVFDAQGYIKRYKVNRNILKEAIQMGTPFMTSGCPGCNRPFYNERVSGPRYNFPCSLNIKEIEEIETLILGV